MSSYRKLSFYGREAHFALFAGYINNSQGHVVTYVSKDVANVTIYHSEWIVPGTLNVHGY